MRTMQLGASDLEIPVVAVGCMRIDTLDRRDAERFVHAALEEGARCFDHADIYGGGACEEVFAEAVGMNARVREQLILQSKCGIRPDAGTYDFSREHILRSVDGILRRLRTEYLDVLLLHRPDTLMEPDEVAEAFDTLEREGKVRHFGVSNHHPRQIDLLKRSVRQPLVANQLQLSLTHASMITSGVHVNTHHDAGVDRDGYVLEYCRANDITIQPWSPVQDSRTRATFLGTDAFPELNAALSETADRHGVTPTTIAIAWLLRHPASMQPVIGTTNVERLRACCRASDVALTREEWYALYRAAGHTLP